ncbi:type VI secretion system contractile sheath small subunit [Niabella drilacis]|uniref:Type VI secretion system, VipA, VC_A0107 or Hcp2 n=1 Tax=Niabella drilacis (strain DSM 25811 / CCM 8410 / CCUG 62505 / LMG 26954 / E90) TaxID=1285928 RepID=A0A1G6VP02_NIADE|nr:type VI secretion system contractile sheath small subunit [Niabella drilacis]SDD54556.1 Type VI secretion system, VipA, VC_A0107 or Hcp2 [Niabella drilacis]
MPLEPYGIGGTEVKTDAFEAFADIPQNRVLLAEKLTDLPPVKPEIVQGLTNIDAVFNHFAPAVSMDFETEEGATRKEDLHFKGLSDFGAGGITHQSGYLSELDMKRQQYQKIVKQLKTNKLLKQALADKETKENLLAALKVLIQELDGSK